MNRIHRAGLAGALSLVLVGAACAPSLAGPGIGGWVAVRQRPRADAVPTTTTATATPAEPTTAFPNPPTVPTSAPPPAAAPTTVPIAMTFVPIEDGYGMLTVEVPAGWTDVDTRPFINDDGTLRPGIDASTDLEAFDADWDTPGLLYTAYRFQPDPNILFGEYDYTDQCTDGGTVPYNDQVFVGYVRTFNACGTAQSTNYVIVANAPGNLVTIVLVVQTVVPADDAAYRHVLETFNVDPNVAMPTETVPPETTAPLPTTPVPTTPTPTAPPTGAVPTVPPPTVAIPTAPPLPTSPLLTTPVTAPIVTAPVPTVAVPTTPGVPAGYHEIADDTGRLSIQVPATWIEIDGAPAVEEGVQIAALSAAPNLATFRDTFNGPGLLIHETPYEVDPAAELARRGLGGTCTPGPVLPNPNLAFVGVYQSWLDCGGTTTDLHVLVANPTDGRQTTVVIVAQTLTVADEEALEIAFASYRINATV